MGGEEIYKITYKESHERKSILGSNWEEKKYIKLRTSKAMRGRLLFENEKG
jgi:hypothetical protein